MESNKRQYANCPICLGSSGIVADGKGSTCKICCGKGIILLSLYNKIYKELGDLVGNPVIVTNINK